MRLQSCFKRILLACLLCALAGCAATEKQPIGYGTTVVQPQDVRVSSSFEANTPSEQVSSSEIDSSSTAQPSGNGRFSVEYITSDQPVFQQWEEYLRSISLFEDVAKELNGTLKIPADISIVFRKCDEVNAYYDPETGQIIMCYQILDDLAGSFADTDTSERSQKVVEAALFIFYHELGHALIHVLDLPITGREEDVADQVSASILIDVGEDGEKAVLSGAEWFVNKRAPTKKMLLSAMSDEHSLDPQRFYNLVCWVYGADPENTSFAKYYSTLPPERLSRCQSEYEQLQKSLDRLLKPYLR